MDLGLEGKACIVTGATRGIGLEVARALRAEGAQVLVVGRDGARVDAVAAELGAVGHPADVTDPAAGRAVVEACAGALGGVDVLVNNAGTSANRSLEELTDDDWREQWELNVMGPLRLMREAAPHMARRGGGRIVNVSSSSGKRPSTSNAAYSVAKAAELSLSRVFADAWSSRGVLVNAVAPGPTATGLWVGPGGLADQGAQARGVSREEVLAATAARLPLGRLATPEEVAAVVVFLCSARAGAVTGAAWLVPCSARAGAVTGAAWSADGGAVASIV